LIERLEGLKKFASTDAFVAIDHEETVALLAYIEELEKVVQPAPSVPERYVLVEAATLDEWRSSTRQQTALRNRRRPEIV